MQEQRITLETAKLAKEKGFDIDYCQCGGFPDCICTDKSPTQSLLQKWLREEHKIYVESNPNACGYGWFIDKTNGTTIKNCGFDGPNSGGRWNNYEDALEIGLQEALKLISNKN